MKPIRFQLHVLEECDSTNEELFRSRSEEGFHGRAILAKKQTAGKGRRGRLWYSGEGNLALSLGFELDLPAESVTLPFTVGVAVFATIRAMTNNQVLPLLKWPNDIYWQGKKLGGILTQAREQSRVAYVVVGVGLNLQSKPPADSVDYPVIALSEAGQSIEAEDFAPIFLENLSAALQRPWVELCREWETLAQLKTVKYRVDESAETVEALQLLEDGRLEVRTSAGEIRQLSSEEVRLKIE